MAGSRPSASPDSQPRPFNEDDPPVHSQPTISSHERIIDNKARRTITTGDEDASRFSLLPYGELPRAGYANTKQLRDAVFSLVVARLKKQNITSTLLQESHFRWILPISSVNESSWRELMESPLTVTIERLRSMMKLERITPSTSDQPGGNTVYYIRSYTFTPYEFGVVLGLLVDESYDMNDKIWRWMEMIHDLGGDAERSSWTIRYCGRTDQNPWLRHIQDLKLNLRTWFGRFLQLTQKEFPEIIHTAEVDMVVDATARSDLAPEILDLREQALISLFGIGVVNTQAGGIDFITPFSTRDEYAFLSLSTTTGSKFSCLQSCPQSMQNAIAIYAEQARDYVNANPKTTGADKRRYTDTLVECIRTQATPSILSIGCALLVTIASDIGGDPHEDSTFYRSGRRSSEIVVNCFNRIIHWEKPFGQPMDTLATKWLADQGFLPFVDVFPWFTKHKNDYPAAGKLLKSYLNETKPIIVLTYGQLPTYMAMDSFPDITANWYYDKQRKTNIALGSDYYIDILGIPKLCKIGDTGEEVVVIPSYHPGYLSQAGLPALKAARLFFLIHQVAWYGMHVVLEHLENNTQSCTRRDLCAAVIAQINKILTTNHGFGVTFAASKKETSEVTLAFNQGKIARASIRRQANASNDNSSAEGAGVSATTTNATGGFPLLIKKVNVPNHIAPRQDRTRFNLSWTEPAFGQSEEYVRVLGPIILPKGVIAHKANNAHAFIYYTREGFDIRDAAGNSLGEKTPIRSGKVMTCTLPISMVVLQTSVTDSNDQELLMHWEDTVKLSISDYLLNEVMSGVTPLDPLESYYPQDFFEQSPTKRSLLVPDVLYLREPTHGLYLNILKEHYLKINPGDLLWLLRKFLYDTFPRNEEAKIIFSSPSEHPHSVFRKLAIFCQGKKYQFHPHRRTALALAHASETGQKERWNATFSLVLAFGVLVTLSPKKVTTQKMRINGQESTITCTLYTFPAGAESFRPGVLAKYEVPSLQADVELIGLADETDDEETEDEEVRTEILGKRGRDDFNDDTGDGDGNPKKMVKNQDRNDTSVYEIDEDSE